ncbi:MAG: hypothetical protein HG446_006030 [Flavobacteriaceae bacterium]|jgi:hypothetical protein|nr:hypothetical protein [Flavobacteriaceae bacterium]
MMSFLFVLSEEMDIIDFAREKSDRYNILSKIVNDGMISLAENKLCLLNIDKNTLESSITNLLKSRSPNSIDYKDRFQKKEIFNKLNFKNNIYVLCNSGFDNQISFLINIFNYIENTSNDVYVLKVENHKAFRNFKEMILKSKQ